MIPTSAYHGAGMQPPAPHALIRWLSVAALVLATINMFGGFAVTRRMLGMFRK